jgi:hypothetical protein
MQSVLGFLVVVALIATVAVLFVGLIGMARGGDFNRKYSNILMRARLGTQLATITLMIAYFAVQNL